MKYDLAYMLPLSIIIFAVSTQLQELSSVDWYEIELKRSQKSGNSGQKAAKKAEKSIHANLLFRDLIPKDTDKHFITLFKIFSKIKAQIKLIF